MSWIKPFTKASFVIYVGNVIDAFQPLDFFHFYPLWYDLWMKRIVAIIDKLDFEHKHFSEVGHLLPPPSGMRAQLQQIVPTYRALEHKSPEDFKIVTNFLARMLTECCPDDPFGDTSTPLYSPSEVEAIIRGGAWFDGNPVAGRTIGKLITVTGSLLHGLYNDFGVDYGWDAYGPFKYQDQSLLIRHFLNLQPAELWPAQFLPSVKDIKIFGLYEGVEWKIACIGCHAVTVSGSPVTDLKKYSIMADGQVLSLKEAEVLVQEFADKAEKLYREIRTKNLEEIKKMVMAQECYPMHKLFEAANFDWRPTPEMYARIENKPLVPEFIPHGKMMSTVEEYVKDFGIDVFAREVLGEEAL